MSDWFGKKAMLAIERIVGFKRQIVGFVMTLAFVLTSVMPSHAQSQTNNEQLVSHACKSIVKSTHDHGDVQIDSHSHHEQNTSDDCCVAFCLAYVILSKEPLPLKRGKMIHLSHPVLDRASVGQFSFYRPPAI